jgi:hypothetical protein
MQKKSKEANEEGRKASEYSEVKNDMKGLDKTNQTEAENSYLGSNTM